MRVGVCGAKRRIDQRVKAFLDRPIEGDWPYLRIDATYVKVRQPGRIVSVAVIVAVGVNTDGRREVLGMDIGPSEAETCWTAFLRKLVRRGLRAVKLVVSDAHEGIKAAVSKILVASWQRCRVHFMRNVLAHAGRSGRRVVSAFIATAFAQGRRLLAERLGSRRPGVYSDQRASTRSRKIAACSPSRFGLHAMLNRFCATFCATFAVALMPPSSICSA